MVVVQAYREVVAQYRILQDRGLEDPFLDLAWQVSPQSERRATEQPLKLCEAIVHENVPTFGAHRRRLANGLTLSDVPPTA